ncbi:MAG: hypothetical protein RMZ43_026915 [Nostoc sp. CmiVER01]|nr:hypothetical protein [Nostoc sp. CmiVER01]MDZ8124180.1 hypothetical protein [Nostoc sp. CmiVER01]MDZ8224806.1 hypothetical protein [Nostoc sp. ChiVER01]
MQQDFPDLHLLLHFGELVLLVVQPKLSVYLPSSAFQLSNLGVEE